MPPRIVKRGGAASVPRKASRAGRWAAAKAPAQQLQGEQDVLRGVEEKPVVEETTLGILDEKVAYEENPIAVKEKLVEEVQAGGAKFDAYGSTSLKQEEGFKDSAYECEKHECLELDDNDPEFEAEEYGGVDEDDKELEQEDVQDLVDEVEEEVEEEAEEEEGDLVEEELEDIHEELERDERVSEGAEHMEIVDSAEEEEHHEVVTERRKRKEFEVFVGGLDKDATEDDLRKVFSQVGQITEIRLMMNPQTKKNKGFAFLRFATIEQAKRAVTQLKNPVINGKQCGVSPTQDSDTLFLGNICKTWTKEALNEKLKHYGVENVEDLTLVEDSNNDGMNRGFAFLEFSSQSDAMDAFKRLQKRDVLFGVDRPAKVSFADSFIDPGDEIMAQVKTLFLDGLRASWDEDRVHELLKKYGVVEKIELARYMPSARRKDFGFVTFDTHDAAVNCAKSINNSELGEGDNKAKVRARLSRPLQRAKGKHFSRGDNRPGRAPGWVARGPWVHPAVRSLPSRTVRNVGSRVPPPASIKRHLGLRDRRPMMSMLTRSRPVAPPPRSYDRRAPSPSYPKSSLKRGYSRHDELPPSRSRAAVDYGQRAASERWPSYRDDSSSQSYLYSDLPRATSRAAPRRGFADDGYDQRYERPPPSYHESRARDFNSLSGSKRSYSSLDDVPPRYADSGARHLRARLDYELGPGPSQYGDAYRERLGRSSLGYGVSRGSISSQDSRGLYHSRHGMGHGGSYDGNDVSGMYQSSYDGDYMSRGGDVNGSSYTSMYSSRGMSGSGYMGPGGSGSYY